MGDSHVPLLLFIYLFDKCLLIGCTTANETSC